MKKDKSPFLLKNDSEYKRWKDKKLKDYPESLDDILVNVGDPRTLTEAEHKELLRVCNKANMVIYKGKSSIEDDHAMPLNLGKKLGLSRLDHNMLSEENGLSKLTVDKIKGQKRGYIPYSNKALQWHTDGYYNRPDHKIHSFILHCVQNAVEGGSNNLLDQEIAYLTLRDQNPDYITALMQADVMTIPARMENGKVARKEETGPVFSIDDSTGLLHMRYTIRKRHIVWKNDEITTKALAALTEFLQSDSPYILNGRLEPGMGLVCNNVLHDRSAFVDDENHRRILYRARFFDRVNQV